MQKITRSFRAAVPSSPWPTGLLATVFHQHLALPQVAIATLFSVRPETIGKRIRDIRQLLEQASHAIQPCPHRLGSPEDPFGPAGRANDVVRN